ncbi:MAG: FHA domain-containing protein [Archangiaceae bacterium]|nr:FHA domain-containing protein [Archangiaceae bacterium]
MKGPPAPIDFEDLLVATLPPPLIDGSLQLVIGRSPGCDVVLDDPAVSARHAAISWDGKTAVLSELGSSNGTFLNGLKLGTHAALRSGDMLAFGRSHFVFLSSEEAHGRLRRLR